MAEEEILTAEQAALLLKVSRKTLYRLAAKGEVRGRKVGRQWRFRERDLLQHLSGRPAALNKDER